MAGGRPLKFENAEQLETAIDAYFEENKVCPTIAGLALALGFTSRISFYNYQGRAEFLNIIKKARLYIEEAHEKRMFEGNATGSIFWLKHAHKSTYSDNEEKIIEKTEEKITPTRWTDDDYQ